MAKMTPRYFTRRDGAGGKLRFFWQPSKELAALRWKLTRLSDRYPEAIAQGDWINAILDAWRLEDAELAGGLLRQWQAGGAGNNHGLTPCSFVPIVVPGLTVESGLASLPAAVSVKSVSALIDAFKDNGEEWLDVSDRTRKDYTFHLDAIRLWAGDIPVAKIRKKRIRDYHKALRRASSLGTANARIRVLSVLFSYALNEEWIEADPSKRLKLKSTPPRVLIWRQNEEDAMIRACEDEGRFDIADMIVAGADIGQRLSDLFAMNDGQWGGNRWRLRQGKRGAIVYPHPTPRLAARLAIASERQYALFPALRFQKKEDHRLFINERTGEPWNQSTFNHEFARIRDIAAKACPSITARILDNRAEGTTAARLQFLDLRDTCVTRMAIAGATIAQIRSVTGHSVGSIQTVLQHYLGSEPELAASSAEHLTALLAQIEAEQKAA